MSEMEVAVFEETFVPKTQALLTRAKAFEVATADDMGRAGDGVKVCQTLVKQADEHKELMIRPYLEGQRRVNAWYKKTVAPLEEAKQILKEKMLAFTRKEKEAQAKLAANSSDDLPATQAETLRVRGDRGSIATPGKRWVFRVTNELLVPRQYLVVDEKLIRAAVKDGVREIPGVEVYEEDVISVR